LLNKIKITSEFKIVLVFKNPHIALDFFYGKQQNFNLKIIFFNCWIEDFCSDLFVFIHPCFAEKSIFMNLGKAILFCSYLSIHGTAHSKSHTRFQ